MGKSVLLPFAIPMFATHHCAVAAGLALASDPNAELQFLNQSTELICDRRFLRGYSSPDLYISDASLFTFPNLALFHISVAYASQYCNEIIHAMLDDGRYVYYSGFDDYFLPGKSWYGERHFIHDGIFCGYDDDEGTFTLAAYDSEWVLRLINIPQQSIEPAMREGLNQGHHVRLTAMQVRKNKIELNIQEILKRLKAYLNSDLTQYPPDKQGMVKGIAVHDYLCMYMDRLLDGSIAYEKMDWRPLRLIWEFRGCMLKRIRAVEEKLGLDDTSSQAYEPLVKETDRLRMLYAFYHKRKKDSVLKTVKDGLYALKEAEKDALEAFVKKMEGEEL